MGGSDASEIDDRCTVVTRKDRPLVAADDADPSTGRERLSCRQAPEEGSWAPMLMKLSGRTSVCSLTKYVRASDARASRPRICPQPARRCGRRRCARRPPLGLRRRVDQDGLR